LTPHTIEAAQWFGRDTEWCTAYGGKYSKYPTRNSQWYSYTSSPLYIIRDKTDPDRRFQFHFKTSQFCDIRDSRINTTAFIQQYPEVDQAFNKVIDEMAPPTHGDFQVIETKTSKTLSLKLTKVNFDMVSGIRGMEAMYSMSGSTITGERDRQGGQYRLNGVRLQNDRNDLATIKQIIDILNAFPFSGDTTSAVDMGIGYDQARRRYMEVGKMGSVMSQDTKSTTGQWKKFVMKNSDVRYVLYENDLEAVVINVVSLLDGDQPNRDWAARLDKVGVGYGDEIFKILKAISNRRGVMLSFDTDFFGQLSKDQGLEIAKMRPDWLSAWDWFRLKGDTPTTRRRLTSMIGEVLGDKTEWIGDRIVLQKWDTLEDFIEAQGDNDAEHLAKFCFGERGYDVYDPYVDEYGREEMLNSLPPEDLTRMVEYFKTHEDYVDFIKEEEIDFSNPVKDILQCHDHDQHRDLEQAFRNAVSSGTESGTVAAMMNALKSCAEGESNIFFLKNGKLEGDFSWDSKIVLAVTCKDMCEKAKNPEMLSDASDDGWPEIFLDDGGKVGPRGNGDYDECDDESRNDAFVNNIDDFLP
jgi:hypothetical protein